MAPTTTPRAALTAVQRSEFEEHGFTRLSGVFSQAEAAAMEERVWRELERKHGLHREDPESWNVPVASGMQRLRTHSVFAPIGGASLLGALDDLFGTDRWQVPKHWGQFLITFPAPLGGPAPPPRLIWHTDFAYSVPAAPLFGALVFSFLGDVPAQTGGTLVIAGSPRHVARFLDARPHLRNAKMKVVRRALMESDPWLSSLDETSQDEDGAGGLVGNADEARSLRVVQLSGEAGDVIVGHPWLLHTPYPNLGDRPRLMCVQRIAAAPPPH